MQLHYQNSRKPPSPPLLLLFFTLVCALFCKWTLLSVRGVYTHVHLSMIYTLLPGVLKVRDPNESLAMRFLPSINAPEKLQKVSTWRHGPCEFCIYCRKFILRFRFLHTYSFMKFDTDHTGLYKYRLKLAHNTVSAKQVLCKL